MALAIERTSYRLSYDDWLDLPEDGRLYEILDGELFVSPAPSYRHQRISIKLLGFLIPFLARENRGEVLHAPLGVKLSDFDVPEPDLLVVLAAHRSRISENGVQGPPDLVVEILSPGTAGLDLGVKRQLYERFGVPEYWIVDPRAEQVEVLTLRTGQYRAFGLFQRTEALRSPLLSGLEIPLAEIFGDSF